jgi:NADPH:quinone reductase
VLPHDTYGRDWGLLIEQKLPAVLGNNVAGIIQEVSSGVEWRVGDEVFGISSYVPMSSDQCGLQEYAVLNANAIAAIPDGFSDTQLVTLPINLVTSAAVLFTATGFNLTPPYLNRTDGKNVGKSVVIVGAGTNVGQLAVQLAHIAGITKTIAVAGAGNSEKLKKMGATHFIDRHASGEDIARQIRHVIGGDGATMMYVCAPLDVALAIEAISPSKPSVLRLLLPLEGDQGQQIQTKRPLCDVSFVDDLTNESLAPHASHFWAQVPQWVRDGDLLPAAHRIITGLDKVDEINVALNAYRDFGRTAAQTVVKIRG